MVLVPGSPNSQMVEMARVPIFPGRMEFQMGGFPIWPGILIFQAHFQWFRNFDDFKCSLEFKSDKKTREMTPKAHENAIWDCERAVKGHPEHLSVDLCRFLMDSTSSMEAGFSHFVLFSGVGRMEKHVWGHKQIFG